MNAAVSQAAVALFGAISQLAPPLALRRITAFMDEYDSDTDNGVPLDVVIAVGGLVVGQVRDVIRMGMDTVPRASSQDCWWNTPSFWCLRMYVSIV